MPSNEIYLEIVKVGAYLRVTAIDAATGDEVIFMAAPDTARKVLEDLAVKKLRYVQKKKND